MEEKQAETLPQKQQTPPVMENVAPQQPVQTPKESGGLPKWVMYILIVAIGLGVAGIGVGVYYYLTKEDKEEVAPEVTTTDTSDTDTTTDDQDTTDTDTNDTDTTEESDQPTQQPQDKEISYVWYEDDYVKFQYPKGWDVTILTHESPKAELDKKVYINQIENYSGVYSIKITNNDDFSFEIYRDGETGRPYKIYDQNNPNQIEFYEEFAMCSAVLELSKKPVLLNIEEYDIMFLGIAQSTILEHTMTPVSSMFACEEINIPQKDAVYVGRDNDEGNFRSFENVLSEEVDLPCLGSVPNEPQFRSQFGFRLSCPAGDDDKFTECFEFLKTFFDSSEEVSVN